MNFRYVVYAFKRIDQAPFAGFEWEHFARSYARLTGCYAYDSVNMAWL